MGPLDLGIQFPATASKVYFYTHEYIFVRLIKKTLHSTKWWDPIGNACLCTTNECQYKDTAVPVNRTANGNGVVANGSGSSSDATIQIAPLNSLFIISVCIVALFF